VSNRLANLKLAITQAGPLRLGVTLLVLIGALLIARYSWNLPLALSAERGLYDVRVDLTAARVDQDDRVVLVVFTEETLTATASAHRSIAPCWPAPSPTSMRSARAPSGSTS
jgi:adenylate cyclase